MTAEQTMLDIHVSMDDLLPTVERLRKGDLLEGYDSKAFPKPLRVLGTTPVGDGSVIEVIYRQRRGPDTTYGVLRLPVGTPVALAPPF